MKQIDLNNEIVIYQSEDGKTQLDVKTIGKHINNTLKEELDDGIPTVAKFATVQKEVTRRPRRLRISAVEHQSFHATYENAMKEIDVLKEKFGYSPLFGNEKDDSFKSSIGQIYQTFGGVDLYPSVEEKAAMLLYLVTKNHSFSDGNKRIADSALVATI